MKSKWIFMALATIVPVVSMAQPPVSSNFVAHMSGDQEVPIRLTNAQGQAVFQLTGEGEFLAYRITAGNIKNVVSSHIHLAPPGSSGPIVAFLYGAAPPGGGRTQGVIEEGLIGSADLVGPLAGQNISVLAEVLRTGGAYVNIHTNDGIGEVNSGPGDFPGGEIRAQIRPAGPK